VKIRALWAGSILLVVSLVATACTGPPSGTSTQATHPPATTVKPTAKASDTQPEKTTLSQTPGEPPSLTFTPTPILTPTLTPTVSPPLPVELPPFTVNVAGPFATTNLNTWEAETYTGVDYSLPVDPGLTANPQVINGLTGEQRSFLTQNGFVVMHSQESQFGTIRKSVISTGQPYFLTTDAALHSLHLTFDELLKALERERLRPQMIDITKATLYEVLSYRPAAQGTSMEEDTLLAAAYLSVALKLFDPEAAVHPSVEDLVEAQIEQIMAGRGMENSVLMPSFTDDYGDYKPVSHYAGDPELETYFRGMKWYGRMHFKLTTEPANTLSPRPTPSRAPLIVTLALRRASVDGRTAAEAWAEAHEVLTFMIGPSDDGGPVEYAALMDEVYGDSPGPLDLADDALWDEFQSRSDELPVPRINSTFVNWVTTQMPGEVGWRFMGSRFTIDGYIFQNLMFDMVEERPKDSVAEPTREYLWRMLPTGPDVMAVFGSPVALDAVSALGEADYPNYYDQVALLQEGVQAQPEDEWLSRFYEAWLYAFFPILGQKGGVHPTYMQTTPWAYREMNTALGSWAELKHDTILYAKMPGGAGGGANPVPPSPPPPGYVEANPEAFYRMAYVAQVIADGLRERGMATEEGSVYQPDLDGLVQGMENIAADFQTFGDIAVKELTGQPLDEADRQAIAESCMSLQGCYEGSSYEELEPPPPIVAAVAGEADFGDEVLEVATGYVDRIYVVVPIDGQLHVAQGGVYSYYEFTQPRSARLTDEEWRERLAGPDSPPLPIWASNFVLPGGESTRWLAFRVGDVYSLTEAGEGVNLRAEPSMEGEIVERLSRESSSCGWGYFKIIDGPVAADGHTWWQVRLWGVYDWSDTVGWLVESQEWYERYD
jgi:hypothetical protein